MAHYSREALRPQPWWYVLGIWALFASYSLFKGMKVALFPAPISWRGALALGVLLALAIALLVAARIPRLNRLWSQFILEPDAPPPPPARPGSLAQAGAGLCFALGLAFLFGCYAWIESRSPYFFTQDDNMAQFLPVMVRGCRSLFDEGIFPTWNAHQWAGAPTTSVGTYALTYPGTYLSYAIARHGFGNEYLTIEVFCLLHLVYGYALLVAWLRKIGVSMTLAVAGSLAFILQGFFLITTRSWYYMAPTAMWFPALLLLAEQLRDSRLTWRWPLGTGLAIGLYFHSGNAQMWLYGVEFWFFVILIYLLTGQIPWSRCLPVLSALLVALGVSLPLLLPQYLETMSAARLVDGLGIEEMLAGLLLPFPLYQARDQGPALYGTTHRQYVGQVMYSGTLFVLFALPVMGSLLAHKWTRREWARSGYAILGLIAFMSACGKMGVIWFVFSKLPIYDKFAQPFKFLPFVTFFATVLGVQAIERVLAARPRRALGKLAIGASVLLLLGYHVSLPLPSAFTYDFQPYPPIYEALRPLQNPARGRVLALAPYRHGSEEFGRMPVNNLPTIQGIYSLTGYDPLVHRKLPASHMLANLGFRDVVDRYRGFRSTYPAEMEITDEEAARRFAALRAYGVRFLFVFGEKIDPPYRPDDITYLFYRGDPFLWQIHRRLETLPPSKAKSAPAGLFARLWTLEDADPLAFARRATETSPVPLPIQFRADGADVSLPGVEPGETVVVNVLDEPGASFLRAYVDGRPVPHTVDRWKRVEVAIPRAATALSLRYEPPFFLGALAGVAAILAGMAIMIAPRRPRLIAAQSPGEHPESKPSAPDESRLATSQV